MVRKAVGHQDYDNPNGYSVTSYFADKVMERIWTDRDKHPYVEQGLISGSKLGDAPLNIILKMLGIEQDFDVYTVGKFRRGHTTASELVEIFTGIERHEQEEGVWLEPKNTIVLQGKVMLEAPALVKGYRGMTNSIDVLEDVGDGYVIHEIKSATKMSYDQVAATGNSAYTYKYVDKKRVRDAKKSPAPRQHNCIQVASYGLSTFDKPVLSTYLHYINADDYRVISFKIDPEQYRAEIDREIDAVQFAFETKTLPVFQPLFKWQSGRYNSFADWEGLSEVELMAKLKADHPDAYENFMTTRITDNGRE